MWQDLGLSSFLVVSVFSIVQSVFGVGLLVFGTPTLLILGYSFSDSLIVLLPASLAISLFQMCGGFYIDCRLVGNFILYCLVPLAAALAFILFFKLNTSLNVLVAVILALFSVMRMSSVADNLIRSWVTRHQKLCLVLMGVVHGISNLGGGLLTIFASAIYRDKVQIRQLIALCYSCFAAIQLGLLFIFFPNSFGWYQLSYALVSTLIFLTVGNHVFRWISASMFYNFFTGLMVSYSLLLALRAANYF